MSTYPFSVALSTPMQLGECPLWCTEQECLFWIDIPAKEVHRLHPESGDHRRWALPSEPGCIALCATGGLVVAMRSGIVLMDTENGQLTPLVDAPYDATLMRFNDGRCDAAGRLWVGTMYEPRDQVVAPLYCLSRGQLSDSGNRATVSNGVAFAPDQKTLYHADTTSHTIRAYDFDLESAALSNGRVFQQFSMDKSKNYGGRPDGAAVDSEGAYWCAMFEGGRILRFSPAGELLLEIPLPARCPTMIAFGGPELRTLYVTTGKHNRSAEELAQYPLSGCVLAIEVDVPGLREYPYIP